MKNHIILYALALLFFGCQKEKISIATNADETFYVRSEGASMRVTVKGNTASKNLLLIVHGGPGGSAYFYRSKDVVDIVEGKVAVAYWDQRVAGASQGGNTGKTLQLAQYGEDLKRVLQVLKARYGEEMQIFLMSQSFGGMVASQFMTQGDNQKLVKGWIFANATHNYQLNDERTRQMLLEYGNAQIAQGKRVNDWQKIVDYCTSIAAPYTLEQGIQLNDYAYAAMEMIDGFTALNEDDIIKEILISNKVPFTAAFANLTKTSRSELPRELVNTEFSSQLQKITTPVLVCAGAYDFVCPPSLGDDFYNRVRSTYKKQLLFTNSGHILEERAAYCNAFLDFIQEVQ